MNQELVQQLQATLVTALFWAAVGAAAYPVAALWSRGLTGIIFFVGTRIHKAVSGER